MNRLGTSTMRVSRASCYREGLTFKFKIVARGDDAVNEAVTLVSRSKEPGKILIFATGIDTCLKIGERLQKEYKGCGIGIRLS